jgi:formamidopyrimidine-DNA glycosylase
LRNLAPEPLSDDFSLKYLKQITAASRSTIKEFLLDQTKVCGLGNIYASESLFSAGVSPMVAAQSLSSTRLRRLFLGIREVLQQAVEHSKSAVIDPRNLEGSYFSGSADHGWLVYDREGMPCTHCKRPIRRVKQGGRSTFYCWSCQR